MATFLEELEAEAKAAEADAAAVALTEDEARAAAFVERAEKAKAAKATALKARRAPKLAQMEREARAKAPPRTLVKGIDLLEFFPLGVAPDPSTLPNDGLIVVRSPPPARVKEVHAAVEHNREQLADIYAGLLCESVVSPGDVTTAGSVEGSKLSAFCEAFPNAATAAGTTVMRLGGSRIQADKRGHG